MKNSENRSMLSTGREFSSLEKRDRPQRSREVFPSLQCFAVKILNVAQCRRANTFRNFRVDFYRIQFPRKEKSLGNDSDECDRTKKRQHNFLPLLISFYFIPGHSEITRVFDFIGLCCIWL